MFDLIVTNADVADGLGNPLRKACVAVKDGRIAAIGHDLGRRARRWTLAATWCWRPA